MELNVKCCDDDISSFILQEFARHADVFIRCRQSFETIIIIYYWNFHMSLPVCLSVGLSVHNFRKGRKGTLQCSYRNICFFFVFSADKSLWCCYILFENIFIFFRRQPAFLECTLSEVEMFLSQVALNAHEWEIIQEDKAMDFL